MHFQAVEMFGFRIIRRALSAIILLAIVLPIFVLGKTWYVAHHSTIEKADVIVVLGAAQFDGRPSDVLKSRLIEAKRIYLLGFAPTIITVGAGAPGDRTTEADSAKNWLVTEGIRKSAVIAVPKGRDTFVSTQSYVAEMKSLKKTSAIIVTDPYHCLRAVTIAKDFGVRSYCSPVTTGVNSLQHLNIHYLLRETGAYLAYVTLGRRGIHVSDHLSRG
jgi:uncharacterized SAM-binding protein YcdF (DUF218 family)